MRCRYLLLALLIGAGLVLVGSLPSPAGESVDKEKIDKLIEQMGSDTFAEREKATTELKAIGAPALEALRKAAKSEDVELSRRASELVRKIEEEAARAKLLAAKRVHLVYKDTPLSEAAADFHKKSGYPIYLHDPKGKLKERTITLDTGATTFWHAYELFCAKAGLTEATLQDGVPAAIPLLLQRIKPQKGALAPPAPLLQITLKDGKAKKLPTEDGSVVRVRALPKADMLGNAPEDAILLGLEATPEPRLQWRSFQSIRIDKALDDQEQNLTQVTPQDPSLGINLGVVPVGCMVFQGGTIPPIPVLLKKGVKASQSLKELKGSITAQMFTEAKPMITAANLAKAAGKTFIGAEGGSIKILEVKSEEKTTTIQLELEKPGETVPPQQINMVGGPFGGGVMVLGKPGAKGVVVSGLEYLNLSVQDNKGNTLPIRVQLTREKPIATYTLICEPGKDQGKPAKVVYLGRKQVTVDIPFTLKDVPLP